MAIVPTSGTNIRFISEIPFSEDYKNTRWFDNLSQQTNYFMNKPVVHSENNATFQRTDNRLFISTNKSIDELRSVNYVMFQNSEYSSKWFYAFVTKLEYKQNKTTYVHFKLDVFQTWFLNMNFKPSFTIREHCPLWNTDGSPVVNTLDEGLNYGSEYDNVDVNNIKVAGSLKWLVIVSKETLHQNKEGETIREIVPTPSGSIQPLSYYILPFRDTNTAVMVNYTASGIPIDKPSEVLLAMYTFENAVNNIVSIYITDHIGLSFSYTEGEDSLTINNFLNYELEPAFIENSQTSEVVRCIYVKNIDRFINRSIQLPYLYDGYRNVTESKLLMYPYTVLTMDDFRGNRIDFKNEYFSDLNPLVHVKGSLGTSNKVSYGFSNYNTINYGELYNKIADEHALINTDPNDIAIITDNLAAFLQGNRNSVQNQKDSAVFNGAMSGVNAGLGVVGGIMSKNPMSIASSISGGVSGVGNSVLAIQGINAKQKDIANVPSQLSKQGSNNSYSFGNGYQGVFIIKKQIKPEYQKKLEDFFNMFGYKINEVKIPNFHTRRNWNYVQTENCNIQGNFGNEDLYELKAIFDGGITLWHTDDIGNYSLNNEVL